MSVFDLAADLVLAFDGGQRDGLALLRDQLQVHARLHRNPCEMRRVPLDCHCNYSNSVLL